MSSPRAILCSGVSDSSIPAGFTNRKPLFLNVHGRDPNVTLTLEDVARAVARPLSDRIQDLLEIAAYVFTADCATERGRAWTDRQSTESWDRRLHFEIGVRDPKFWSDDAISEQLVSVLSFLSDDEYSFRFHPLRTGLALEVDRIEFGDDEQWTFDEVDRVIMFSGGLDSLAGALETASSGHPLVLASHRPFSIIDSRQRNLFELVKARFEKVPMIHVPVWVNKRKGLDKESTQRTRSFLFSAIGAAVAELVQAKGVRFYENGVVSLNLPVADEVLRARASRTTHPYALDEYSRLYSLVLERPFAVDNPYIFCTKADVVEKISSLGASDLIEHTVSCATPGHRVSTAQRHCGSCSQCIDRRIAVLAVRLGADDPETDYVTDVLTGHRDEGYPQGMAVGYSRHATELANMGEQDVVERFSNELQRATLPYRGSRRQAAERFVDLHLRHGRTVVRVLRDALNEQAEAVIHGRLDRTSMLGVIASQQHARPTWEHYADRIADALRAGLPASLATHPAKNEPHLQEICDGILRAKDFDLTREFPFLSWSASTTKPDWSCEGLGLWVELKYVRQKSDIRTISEDIAADITKYGDNGRRVLYVVYDPHHLIIDEREFSEPISKRPTMMARFIR